jgi:hypothetical protein
MYPKEYRTCRKTNREARDAALFWLSIWRDSNPHPAILRALKRLMEYINDETAINATVPINSRMELTFRTQSFDDGWVRLDFEQIMH